MYKGKHKQSIEDAIERALVVGISVLLGSLILIQLGIIKYPL